MEQNIEKNLRESKETSRKLQQDYNFIAFLEHEPKMYNHILWYYRVGHK